MAKPKSRKKITRKSSRKTTRKTRKPVRRSRKNAKLRGITESPFFTPFMIVLIGILVVEMWSAGWFASILKVGYTDFNGALIGDGPNDGMFQVELYDDLPQDHAVQRVQSITNGPDGMVALTAGGDIFYINPSTGDTIGNIHNVNPGFTMDDTGAWLSRVHFQDLTYDIENEVYYLLISGPSDDSPWWPESYQSVWVLPRDTNQWSSSGIQYAGNLWNLWEGNRQDVAWGIEYACGDFQGSNTCIVSIATLSEGWTAILGVDIDSILDLDDFLQIDLDFSYETDWRSGGWWDPSQYPWSTASGPGGYAYDWATEQFYLRIPEPMSSQAGHIGTDWAMGTWADLPGTGMFQVMPFQTDDWWAGPESNWRMDAPTLREGGMEIVGDTLYSIDIGWVGIHDYGDVEFLRNYVDVGTPAEMDAFGNSLCCSHSRLLSYGRNEAGILVSPNWETDMPEVLDLNYCVWNEATGTCDDRYDVNQEVGEDGYTHYSFYVNDDEFANGFGINLELDEKVKCSWSNAYIDGGAQTGAWIQTLTNSPAWRWITDNGAIMQWSPPNFPAGDRKYDEGFSEDFNEASFMPINFPGTRGDVAQIGTPNYVRNNGKLELYVVCEDAYQNPWVIGTPEWDAAFNLGDEWWPHPDWGFEPNWAFHGPIVVEINVAFNQPPILEPIPALFPLTESIFEFPTICSDPEGEQLYYTDDSDLFDITEYGLIRFTPTVADLGTQEVTVGCSDGKLETIQTFSMTILDANDVKNVAGTVCTPEGRYHYKLNFGDTDTIGCHLQFDKFLSGEFRKCEPGLKAGCASGDYDCLQKCNIIGAGTCKISDDALLKAKTWMERDAGGWYFGLARACE